LIVVVIVVVVAIVVVVFVVVVLGKKNGKNKILSSRAKKLKNRYLHGTELRSNLSTDFVPWYWYVEPKNQVSNSNRAE
jgi:flagellar basal body-associated protein FliL